MTPLTHTRYLIIGAGMSGLAFANFLERPDYLILERDEDIGGWCKTVYQDGFVWDYSGHFFHFKHPEIERYLVERMPEDEVVTVEKISRILAEGVWVDFPFQKNIHQLPQQAFIDCLYDLYFRQQSAQLANPHSFKGMLYEKFGRSIAEKFLIPYNTKLYACDLDQLDRDAMGRFFPHASLEDVVRNMRAADNDSYNATFTYPRGGAIQYVNALKQAVPDERLWLGEGLAHVDLKTRTARTTRGRVIRFEHLISSAPFPALLDLCEMTHERGLFTSNKVLVFNLGFDQKGPSKIHWAYFPDPELSFYRVGFYDNILEGSRMSLYVEIGLQSGAAADVDAARARVLEDLRKTGILTHQELISHHHVVLDPAYVHITQASRAAHKELCAVLALGGVHSIGRYGGWTYCSIEDNIVEARALARQFNALDNL